ncbi:MAG: DUF4159 domain-containing protein [Kiloniellaceae bacterium]
MLNLGPLAFAQPWLLLALAGLPLLWLLLRVTPPAPRALRFPAIRLLFGLQAPEETPARTPWWLILLRMTIAALIIGGLARPLLNPATRLAGDGPLLLVIDDGWSAARNWPAREAVLDDLLNQAEREGRAVVVLTTARDALEQPPVASGLLPAAEARRLVQGVKPKPWPADRAAALAALDDLDLPGAAHVVWLSDGLDDGRAAALAERLRRFGRLELLRDPDAGLARLVLAPKGDGIALIVRLRRAASEGEDIAAVLATGDDGGLIGRVPVTFADGAIEAETRIDLPGEMRNRIARLAIEGESSAGAVMLLDERWRRRPVGLVASGPLEDAQPLLSELYYLQRALDPFTELRRGTIGELLQREIAVLALPDTGVLIEQDRTRLNNWVERGGLLLRFAGPRLAESGIAPRAQARPPLLPVRLRGGNRTLSGALTWDKPARLAPFDRASPFTGLAVPPDVLIQRQVLAEPSLELGEKTWARLADGTPLVTAERRGEGWVVLVHTTANTDWSNLPLSGLFVEMLRRIVAVSQGVPASGLMERTLPPIETLDGFGRLGPPAPTTLALDRQALEEGRIEPRHPPGYYGVDGLRRAHNLGATDPALVPIGEVPSGVNLGFYTRDQEIDLKPWLLAAALLLTMIDLVIALALRGLLGAAARHGAAVVLLAALLPFDQAAAQAGAPAVTDEARALEATLQTHLAYVVTGVPAVDEVSRAGLEGLTRVLERRTSVEAGAPLGVDPARDELAFFPLLYWPIAPEQRDLTEIAVRKLNAFMQNGGTILIDLREPAVGGQPFGRASRAVQALRRLTRGLDIPPLAPVPPDHVLTKAFYLMQEFPGRFSGGTLWIEAAETRVNDGVTPVLIGSNDWAGAWAVNQYGRPLSPVVPGGERQRELAYRFGVNLTMYAMTGNYKADQVHVPFILERLGQ